MVTTIRHVTLKPLGNYKTYHFDYNAGYNYFNIYKNNNFVAYNANSATL